MNICGKAITLNIAYEIECYGGRGLLRWDPIRQATWKEWEKSVSDMSIWGILLITREIPPRCYTGVTLQGVKKLQCVRKKGNCEGYRVEWGQRINESFGLSGGHAC